MTYYYCCMPRALISMQVFTVNNKQSFSNNFRAFETKQIVSLYESVIRLLNHSNLISIIILLLSSSFITSPSRVTIPMGINLKVLKFSTATRRSDALYKSHALRQQKACCHPFLYLYYNIFFFEYWLSTYLKNFDLQRFSLDIKNKPQYYFLHLEAAIHCFSITNDYYETETTESEMKWWRGMCVNCQYRRYLFWFLPGGECTRRRRRPRRRAQIGTDFSSKLN